MKKYLPRWRASLLALVLAALAAGCATPKEGEDRERRSPRQSDVSTPYRGDVLAPAIEGARTIQLFPIRRNRTEVVELETELPIWPLGSDPAQRQLQLKFDLLERAGRPLSVYFYHADRQWQRRLVPSQYLESFTRDQILDYSPSIGTEVPYVHYQYAFPNDTIRFLLSGNYVLRVTEQGDEEAVLFEVPFFVTEQAASVDFGIERVMAGGLAYSLAQPILRFAPPQSLGGTVFDYNACFVQNGMLETMRCSARPRLSERPNLLFELEREAAFAPATAEYFTDVADLRAGGQVEQVDFGVSPYRVLLEPDYAKFPATSVAPFLSGQPVVSSVVRDVVDADVGAQYVSVRFAYVPPDERRLAGDLVVAGSFNRWQPDPDNALAWVPARGRYEGDVLLKQGQYEYRYLSDDPRLARELRGVLPRTENLYTAFVYFSDITEHTDRLLAVTGVLTQ